MAKFVKFIRAKIKYSSKIYHRTNIIGLTVRPVSSNNYNDQEIIRIIISGCVNCRHDIPGK